jgi:hypothetical protein
MLRQKSLFLFLFIFSGHSIQANLFKIPVRVASKASKIAMKEGLVQLYQGVDPIRGGLLVGGGITFFAVRACVQSKVLRNRRPFYWMAKKFSSVTVASALKACKKPAQKFAKAQVQKYLLELQNVLVSQH